MTYQALLTDAISDGSSWHVRVSSYVRGRERARRAGLAAPAGGDGAHGRAVGHGDAHGRPRGPRRVGRAAELGRRADRLLLATSCRRSPPVVEGYRPGTMLGYLNSLFKCRRRAPRARRGPAARGRGVSAAWVRGRVGGRGARRGSSCPWRGGGPRSGRLTVDGAHYRVKAVNAAAFFKSAAGGA